MRFLEHEFKVKNLKTELTSEEADCKRVFANCNYAVFKGSKNNLYFCADTSTSSVVFCSAIEDEYDYELIRHSMRDVVKESYEKIEDEFEKEITLKEFYGRVTDIGEAERKVRRQVRDKLYDLKIENVGSLSGFDRMNYDDNFVDQTQSEFENMIQAEELATCKDLQKELERVYSTPKQKATGHPVHYFVISQDRDVRRETYRTLLNALYEQNRIINRRYCYVDIDNVENFRRYNLESFYVPNNKGTVVIRLESSAFYDSSMSAYAAHVIKDTCSIIEKYKDKVLTIVCFKDNSPRLLKEFYENLNYINVVEIADSDFGSIDSVVYLKSLARKRHVKIDKLLTNSIVEDKYSQKDLDIMFETWYKNKMKNKIYPQYKNCNRNIEKKVEKVEAGSAYERLNKLIGLDSIKKSVDKILAYYKFDKFIKPKNLKGDALSMNMMFTGNPGSAKTTVARLLGQILKDNGILDKGQFVECGRGDLVGKFVGWTAQTVKEKFKDAQGGVLFIDEAYALCDDREGSYGDEAINTIVQEMENRRGTMLVIFAGYPDKMRDFLKRNPGLQSRINFTLEFEDYSTDELCDIAKLIAKDNHFFLEDEAVEKMREHFATIIDKSEFGNGRYVRNIIEQAQLSQSERIVNSDYSKMDEKQLMTICASDIEFKAVQDKQRRIGF